MEQQYKKSNHTNQVRARLTFIICIAALFIFSCKKADFLDKKPNTGIVVPETLSDLVQLLDNLVVSSNTPPILYLSADEYYYTDLTAYNNEEKVDRDTYIWDKDLFRGENTIKDWNQSYTSVFYANVALDQLTKLNAVDQYSEKGKLVKGWALFMRSYALYNLVQTFAPAYDPSTANTDPGIPLKLSANINDIQQRASVKICYDQILSDLNLALGLIPNDLPARNISRPSKVAIYALLSRIQLAMRDYTGAESNSKKCLQLNNKLMDFNQLDTSSYTPIDRFNPETIFFSRVIPTSMTVISQYGHITIDPRLVELYEKQDLRSFIFFFRRSGNFLPKSASGYDGANYQSFSGLAVDEIYLIDAECKARRNDLSGALASLNTLLKTRYITGKYSDFDSGSQTEILNKILLERRKELFWRGVRWSDLKRLNKEGANITLTRVLNGKTYTLPPNDPRYILPIPDDEIALSHIQQNPR